MFVPKEEWMKKNLTKLAILVTAILSVFTLFTSCPPDPVGPNEDPSAIAEPQYPVYLLLLENEDGTPAKGLYYNVESRKWYKNYEGGKAVNEFTSKDTIDKPTKTVKVEIEVPYKDGSKDLGNPTLTGDASFVGYISTTAGQSITLVNKDGNLDPSYFESGISRRTIARAKFGSATIDLSDLNSKVNDYIKNQLKKDEEVDYWTTDGSTKQFTDEYTTDKKNSKITLTTTSRSPRLDFDLEENTYENATNRVYFNNGKWYLDLTFENSISSIVPPQKVHKVNFYINPNDIEPLSDLKNPEPQTSTFKFLGYKDNENVVIDDKGKINDGYTIQEVKKLSPEFEEKGSGINLNAMSYKIGTTEVKGYVFKGWKKSLEKDAEIITGDDGIYDPLNKEENFYASWEPIVYSLNLNSNSSEGVSVSVSKIYYWKEHGWYSSNENLSEDSSKIEKITPPKKEWTVNIDDEYEGRVIEEVLTNSTTYRGLSKVISEKVYSYKTNWTFNGYSVPLSENNSQKFIDKDGNIIKEVARLNENKDATWSWADQSDDVKVLLPTKSDMNRAASSNNLSITRTFAGWIVKNGSSESSPITDGVKFTPKDEYLYQGLESPTIRISPVWIRDNGITLVLNPGESTTFFGDNAELKERKIYSEISSENRTGAWFTDPDCKEENKIENISEIGSLPEKNWVVRFDTQVKGRVDEKDYSFDFKGFIKDGTTFVNESGELRTPQKTNEMIEVAPTFEPRNYDGVEVPQNLTKDGYKLLGWSRDKNAKVSDDDLKGKKYFTPKSSEVTRDEETKKVGITLYAVWESVVNQITLTAPGVTNGSLMTKALYTRLDENGVNQYYFDEACEKPYNDHESELVKPEKIYTIKFTNTKGRSVSDVSVIYNFEGYKTVSMEAKEEFIDESGKLVYQEKITTPITLEAVLSTHNEIELVNPDPDGVVVGYEFNWWSETQNGKEFDAASKEYTSNITLYGVWTPKIFTLTLDPTNATDVEGATSVLYYQYEDGWYKEKSDDGKVVASSKVSVLNQVVLPKKTLTVKYDKNTNEEVIVTPENIFTEEYKDEREFQFNSFTDDNGKAYITRSSNNTINIVDKIDKDILSHATWHSVTPIDVNKYSVKLTGDAPSHIFDYWSVKDENGEEIDRITTNQYKPDVTVEGDVTLCVEWKSADLLTLDFDDNGATTEEQNSIYYRPGVNGGSGVWYSDSEGTIILENNTLTNLPEKKWTITFIDDDETVLRLGEAIFTFGGYYVDTSSSSENIQINSVGVIKEGSYLTKDTTLVARWSEKPKGVILTSPEKKTGYNFKGWSLSKNGTVIDKDEYIPDNDNTTLYAVWESEVYSLYLYNVVNVDDENPSLYKTLYYKYNVGWYNDVACTDAITTSIAPPKSTITIRFDVDNERHPSVATPQDKVVNRAFNGYYISRNPSSADVPIVSKDGVLNQSEKLTGDTQVFSQWKNPVVSLPQGLNDPGWTFLYWNDNGTYYNQKTFEPDSDILLTAVWQAEKYVFSLDFNGATYTEGVPSTIYYKTGSGWYASLSDADNNRNNLSTITIPKREYIVSFSTTPHSDPIDGRSYTNSYKFQGFKNGSETIIDSVGNILDVPHIYENRTISASWVEDQKLNIPDPITDRVGYNFKGWTEVDGSSASIDKASFRPQIKNTTLYAIYEPKVLTLTLALYDEETFVDQTRENTRTKEVYYVYEKGWSSNKNYYVELDSIFPPRRNITVTFDKNAPTPTTKEDPHSETRDFEFLGFADKTGRDLYTIISKDEKGNITNVNINPERKLLEDTTVYAQFEPFVAPITLPSYSDVDGWEHTRFNANDDLRPEAIYTPTDNITLVADWNSKPGRITFDFGKTNPEIDVDIYYTTERDTGAYMWYSDPACSEISKITNIKNVIPNQEFPKKYYTVSYDKNSSESEDVIVNEEDLEKYHNGQNYEYVFKGFELSGEKIVDENGNLQSNIRTQLGTGLIDAIWEPQSEPFSLIVLNNSSAGEFMGWNKTGEIPDDRKDLYSKEVNPFNSDNEDEKKDMVLRAVWGYTYKVLNLNSGEDATDFGTTAIYYVTSDSSSKPRGWYKNLSDPARMEVIDIPEKVFTVKLDYDFTDGNGAQFKEIEYKSIFSGYYDGADQWITAGGAMSDERPLSEDEKTLTAHWDDGEALYLYRDYSKTRSGYKFVGWSKEKNVDTSTDDWKIPEEWHPTENNTTIYAIWDGHETEVTLNAGDKTGGEPPVKLIYKFGTGWYRVNADDKKGDRILSLDSNEIPTKTYNVNFKPRTGDEMDDEKTKQTSFNFNGFMLNGREQVIRQTGIMSLDFTTLEDNITITAAWSETPSPILLDYDIYTKKGYEFVGWSTDPNASPNVAISNSTYIPTENDITLYGIWRPNVYKLSLSAPDRTDSEADDTPTNALYYKVDDGWYFDPEASTQKLSSDSTIIIPKKVWPVTLLANFGGFTSDVRESEFSFKGYFEGDNERISSDGVFDTSWKIESDMTITAVWGDQTSIELPQLSQTGYIFYGWSEQNIAEGGRNNVLKANEYIPRRYDRNLVLYGISNSNIFMLNLTADDGNGTVESSVSAIYYKAPSSEGALDGGWYLDPTASGEKIESISIPSSHCTVIFDEIYINGLRNEGVITRSVNRQFVSYSVNGEEYIDKDGNIVKNSITSSYNAYATWGDYDTITPSEIVNTSELLKRPYLVYKEWKEKESGNVITEPYKPTRNITIVPEYRRSYIEVYFDSTTNRGYNDHNFEVVLNHDRLWLDVVDGKWYLPYGDGQLTPEKTNPIDNITASFKSTTYSTRIANPYASGSGWTTDTTSNNWKGNPDNLTKDLTDFYTDYDTDTKTVKIDLPIENIKGIGYVVNSTTLRMFTDENLNLLSYSQIKNNNPGVDFEEGDATYHACVLYTLEEPEPRTTSVDFPTSDIVSKIKDFEYANRPTCVVFNTYNPRTYSERRKYRNNYNDFCNEHSDYDMYYYLGTGLRIIEVEVTHANVPNVIYSITRSGTTFNKEDGNTIVFDHTDNNTELTHYLLPYRYNFGDYIAIDTSLADASKTDYAIQRVNVAPERGTYVSSTNGKINNNDVMVTMLDGTTKKLKDVTIIPYTEN